MTASPLTGADLARLGFQALEQAHGAIALITSDLHFAWVNEEFTRLTGYTSAEILGQPLRTLRSELHEESYYDEMLQALAKRGHWQGEVWRRKKSGEAFPALLMISAIHDAPSGRDYYVDLFVDIDRISEGRDRLEFVVNHDALTELPNRRLFWDRLELVLRRAERYRDEQVALIFIDLDRFKAVNDSLGHRFGDRLLIQVAEVLQGCLRGADTIARVGGDEFVVMLEGVAVADTAEDAKARIREALDAVWANLPPEIPVGASVGHAVYPDDAGDAESLYAAADARMYAAKGERRDPSAGDGR